MKRAFVLAVAIASAGAGCSGAAQRQPAPGAARSYAESAVLEQSCVARLQTYLTGLEAKRLDAFFSAALNGLVDCESAAGLAHVPTRDVSRWLANATGTRHATALPKSPSLLGRAPANDATRLAYQRACAGYMRRYIPASIANAGDDPDVAAAFTFNALEQCDSEAGFATIEPRDLAAIMQAKNLL